MTDQAVRAAAHAGLCLAGRYRLEAVIATGGMGTVWSAEDTFLGRQVAVKVLTWQQGTAVAEGVADRVSREARAAASLRHPNVACVYDYGHQDGLAFLVMELLDGESLAARLYRRGAVPPEEAARVAGEVAGALDAAHRAGIVHRDVKPGNIVLTAAGEVKLLDFGIAAISGQRSPPGQERLLGTAAYLAPERAPDAPADPASDVYALGVVVYEMLAGRPPFSGDSLAAVAAAHAASPPPPLALLAPGVPPAMAAVCERALAKDPAARPPSAGALAAQLTAALSTRQPARPAPGAAETVPAEAHGPGGPEAVAGAGRMGLATAPVWPPPVSAGHRARKAARPRSRWRSLAVALTAVLALAAALHGAGVLQDLLGARGAGGGSPVIDAPATGPGQTGSTPTITGGPRDRGGRGGRDGNGGGNSGDSSGNGSRSSDSGSRGGGDQRDRNNDHHSGPGSGGSS